MFRLLLTVLLCFSYFANGFPITDCGSTLGNFSRVTITGCDQAKNTCILRKGTNATIEIDFVTNEDASDLKAVVHGTVLIIPVPFNLPQPDACKDPNSGVTCPLKKGVSVTIKWELQDQNGKDIVCIKLPAKIR